MAFTIRPLSSAGIDSIVTVASTTSGSPTTIHAIAADASNNTKQRITLWVKNTDTSNNVTLYLRWTDGSTPTTYESATFSQQVALTDDRWIAYWIDFPFKADTTNTLTLQAYANQASKILLRGDIKEVSDA